MTSLCRRCALAVVLAATVAVSPALAQDDREDRRAQVRQCRLLLRESQRLIAADESDSALVVLAEARVCNPDNPDPYYQSALLLLARADTSDASALIEQGLAKAPLDRRMRLLHARVLLGRGEAEAAAGHLDRVLMLRPRDGEAMYLRGLAHAALGDTAAAFDIWDRALTRVRGGGRE